MGFDGNYTYYPPTGYIWVLRDIEAGVTQQNNQQILVGIGTSTQSWPIWVHTFSSGLTPGTVQWQGRWVVDQTYGLNVETNDHVNFIISGYQLTTP